MAPHHPSTQGEKVGLWHFDEDEEVWKNEGEGEVTAENKMKALVEPLLVVERRPDHDQDLRRRPRDRRPRPRRSRRRTSRAKGRSYLGSSHAMSDDDGNFCLEARVSSVIELSTLGPRRQLRSRRSR